VTATLPAGRLEWALWGAGALCAGALIGLVAAATRPEYAIALALALPLGLGVVLRPELVPLLLLATVFAESLSIGGLAISRLAAPLALLVLAVHFIRHRSVRLPDGPVLWAVGAYVAWAAASVLWTVNPSDSFAEGGSGFTYASLAISLVYMLAFAVLVDSDRDLRRLGAGIWALAVFAGTVAVVQYIGGGYHRAVSYQGDANFFAALQVLALPACVVVAGRLRTPLGRLVGYLGVALVVGSVIVSLSRGGLLALVLVLALVAAQPHRFMFRSASDKRVALVAAGLGAALLLYGAFTDLAARSESLFNTSEEGSGRVNLWRAAESGWREHEVRGLGYGAFPSQSNRLLLGTPGVNFKSYKLRVGGQVAHNAYIGSAAELGVVGLLLFVIVLLTLFRSVRGSRGVAAEAGDRDLASACTAMMIAVLGFALVSLFLSTETDRSLWVMLGLAIAMQRVARTRGEGWRAA
jgi:O-antigen ligase